MPKPKYYRLKSTAKDATTVNKVEPKLYSPDEETAKNLKVIDKYYKPLQGGKMDYMQMLGGLPKVKIDKSIGNKAEFYRKDNTMVLGGKDKYDHAIYYLEELAHGVQKKNGDKIVGKPGEGYETPGNSEYDAHKIISPELFSKYLDYPKQESDAYEKLKQKPKKKYKLK